VQAVSVRDRSPCGTAERSCDNLSGEVHIIRKGAVVFWHQTNVEYDEWRACCRKHAKAEAEQVY
jgi:hypothetical protein